MNAEFAVHSPSKAQFAQELWLSTQPQLGGSHGGGGFSASIAITADVHFIKLACETGAPCSSQFTVNRTEVDVHFTFELPGEGEGEDSPPKFKLDGEAHFTYPCAGKIQANATLALNMGDTSIDGFVVTITAACGGQLADTAPAFTFRAYSTVRRCRLTSA